MRVAVLGSGSRGNAIAIGVGDSTLLVDAGFGMRSLTRRAKTVGIPIDSLVGIVLTHEHRDHSRGAHRIAHWAGCPIIGSAGTLSALRHELDGVSTTPIDTQRPLSIASFTVACCRTSHDAAEPLTLTVEDQALGLKVGIAYDLGRPSSSVRHLLRGCHCLIVEANHDDLMLRAGPYPPVVRERIAGPDGHLSNRVAAELLADLFHDGLSTVVLAHLSDRCNRPALAEGEAREALKRCGFKGRLLVAEQDHPLPVFEVFGLGKRGDGDMPPPLSPATVPF